MRLEETIQWLKEDDDAVLDELWTKADTVRKETVGEEVHLRGLIEISNYCVRRCAYCGLRTDNKKIERYRMSKEEVMQCARQAVEYGYGTVVIQAGEDYGLKTEWMAEVIRDIKAESNLAVTLSLGERPDEDLEIWREAGADRYLLRFETSDPKLYELIHPPLPNQTRDRFYILRKLQQLGYEAGSGVMIGIPGQTYASLARDILTFGEMDLDMIGVGPYIPHPDTPLGSPKWLKGIPEQEQVKGTEMMAYKVIALTRLTCPEANIPSTTALATINLAQGREFGLMRGANVVMPNLTPVQYRAKYEIYPSKACIKETSEDCRFCIQRRILSIGRTLGKGQGCRIRKSVNPSD